MRDSKHACVLRLRTDNFNICCNIIGADLYKLVLGQSIGERDVEGVEEVGNGEGVCPSPADSGALGTVVSSPSVNFGSKNAP